MAITEQNVEEYITNIGKTAGKNTTVWAVKMPSVFNMVVFGPMANVFDLQYNLINISPETLIIIGVDGAGRLTPLHVCLDKKEIVDIKIKKKMMGCNIEIMTENGSLKYTINKIMIGSSFHKANYDKVMGTLSEWQA